MIFGNKNLEKIQYFPKHFRKFRTFTKNFATVQYFGFWIFVEFQYVNLVRTCCHIYYLKSSMRSRISLRSGIMQEWIISMHLWKIIQIARIKCQMKFVHRFICVLMGEYVSPWKTFIRCILSSSVSLQIVN